MQTMLDYFADYYKYIIIDASKQLYFLIRIHTIQDTIPK